MIAKKQPQPGHRLVDRAPLVTVVLLEIMQERHHHLLPSSEAHVTPHCRASRVTQRTYSSSVRLRKDLSWMKRMKVDK